MTQAPPDLLREDWVLWHEEGSPLTDWKPVSPIIKGYFISKKAKVRSL